MFLIYKVQVHYQNDFFWGGGLREEDAFPFYPLPHIAVIQGHIREFSGVGKMYSMTAVTPRKLALLFWQ